MKRDPADNQIGTRLWTEIERTLWRLQFVGPNCECLSTISTGQMDDGIEIQIIVREALP